MKTTKTECEEVLEYLEENFKQGPELQVSIREEDEVYYLHFAWVRPTRPRAHELFPPPGWVLEPWQKDEERSWESVMYKVI